MTATLSHPVAVLTCIACGARTRSAACPDGCDDVPLDLVEAADVDALATYVDALRARVESLRAVAEAASEDPDDLASLRDAARSALRLPVPARDPAAAIVPAWGCPVCGRVDAPQPCLGVCIRRPVRMVDAGELRRLAPTADALEAAGRALGSFAHLAANVRPRPGNERATAAAIQSAARAALEGGADAPMRSAR